MGNLENCKDIVQLHNSILLAAIIEKTNLLGAYFRKPMVPPNEERFKLLRIQTVLMVSMASNNQDYFGELGYVMFHSKLLDVFLFPLGKSRKLRVLAVAVKRPYDHEMIAKKVLSHVTRIRD
ncbi:MAG TPA: hypothetical protein VLA68_00520 [Nitrososphaera sp.]|nr:hypothetical protein [Nitrososphaera sp.]